jgi:hypothetical protein
MATMFICRRFIVRLAIFIIPFDFIIPFVPFIFILPLIFIIPFVFFIRIIFIIPFIDFKLFIDEPLPLFDDDFELQWLLPFPIIIIIFMPFPDPTLLLDDSFELPLPIIIFIIIIFPFPGAHVGESFVIIIDGAAVGRRLGRATGRRVGRFLGRFVMPFGRGDWTITTVEGAEVDWGRKTVGAAVGLFVGTTFGGRGRVVGIRLGLNRDRSVLGPALGLADGAFV